MCSRGSLDLKILNFTDFRMNGIASHKTSPKRSSHVHYVLCIAALLSLLTMAVAFDAHFRLNTDADECEMSYMRPLFVPLPNITSRDSRFYKKYGLYRYLEQYVDAVDAPIIGVPLLFLPGNGGSYKQVRSIASMASKNFHSPGTKLISQLDFFAVDLNEEFSGLHGGSLLEQSEYVNDVIAYLLDRVYPASYATHNIRDRPVPRSIIILAHSMGGFVARTIFTMPNYVSGSVNTIITLSTPHYRAPAPVDFLLTQTYTTVNEFWHKNLGDPQSILSDVSLVSIAGGNMDKMVSSDLSHLGSKFSQQHGMTVFTTGVRGVWIGADHQAILWCGQIVRLVVRALEGVVDTRTAKMTWPLDKRMLFFKKVFYGTQPTGTHFYDHNLVTDLRVLLRPQALAESLMRNQQNFLIDHAATTSTEVSFDLAEAKRLGKDIFFLVSSMSNENIVLLGCNSTREQRKCSSLFHLVEPLKRGLSVGNIKNLSQLSHQSIVIDLNGLGNQPIYMKAGFASTNIVVVMPSLLDLLFTRSNQVSTGLSSSEGMSVNIPNIDSSLFVYRLKLHTKQCSTTKNLVLRMRSLTTGEAKFVYSSNADQHSYSINFHETPDYVDRSSLSESEKGITVDVWSDFKCKIDSFTLTFDVYATAGQLLKRYSSAWYLFPFLVTICIFGRQLYTYQRTGSFPSFNGVLKFHLTRECLIFLPLLSALFWIHGTLFKKRYPIESSSLLVPLFWLWSVGAVAVVYQICAALLFLVTQLCLVISRLKKSQDTIVEEKRGWKRRIAILSLLLILMSTIVPVQFGFLVAYILHLYRSGQSQASMNTLPRSPISMVSNKSESHYQHSILLMMTLMMAFNGAGLLVWIKNISISWVSTHDHNVLAVLPFIVFSAFTSPSLPPSPCMSTVLSDSGLQTLSTITKFVFGTIVVYALVNGVSHTYVAFYLTSALFWYLSLLNFVPRALMAYRNRIYKRPKD